MEFNISTKPEVRFIRLPEVISLCGRSRSSIYAAIKRGEFPSPVKVSIRSSAWVSSEVAAWVEAQIRARRSR